jgi:hypothetical protein
MLHDVPDKRPFRSAALLRAVSWALASLLSAAPLAAQLPVARLNAVFPPGGKQGSQFDVTLTGTDLELVDQLRFSHPGITAVQKMQPPGPVDDGPQPVPNQFTVSIAGNVPPGLYEVRAVGKFGISNARAFSVGTLDEINEQEPNNTREQAQSVNVGQVVNGQINGATDTDCFRIAARKGQRILIDCWSERIDSRLDATLAVYDAAGREIESSRDVHGRDPVIDLIVPADGEYVIRLWDFIYGGSTDHFYRLSISEAPYIDFVLPAAGLPGTKAQFEIYGRNLPGGQPAGETADRKPLQKLTVTIDVPSGAATQQVQVGTLIDSRSADIDGFEYRLSSPAGVSNPVLIGFAAAPIVPEQEPNDPANPQKVSVPCEFTGQFQKPRDVDCITFDAAQGEVYVLEMVAQRQASAADPYFIIERVQTDAQGNVQFTGTQEFDDRTVNAGGTLFNTTSDDPAARFAVPATGTYRVVIRDLYNRGGVQYFYRLAIRPEQPDFRVVAVPRFPTNNNAQADRWSVLLRKGGAELIDLYVVRKDGFNGEIEVTAQGLPPGVACPPAYIGPGQNWAPLTLLAAENAAAWVGEIQLLARARIGDRDVTQSVRGGQTLWNNPQNQSAPARLTRNIALAVTDRENAPFTVILGEQKTWEVSRAGTLQIPVSVQRRDGFNGAVALNPVYGVPAGFQVPALNIPAGQNSGNLQVTLQPQTLPGAFNLALQASSQVSYKRNEDLAEQAKARQAAIDKKAAELDAASKKAADEAKAAADKAKAAADALAKDPQNKQLQDAKAAADAEAAQAKQRADEAAALAKAAADAKTAAAQQVTNLTNAARPQNVNVFFPTTAVTVKVAEAPIVLKPVAAATVKAGDKVEVTVQIERLFGYADPVDIELVPGNVGGVQAQRVTIPKDQTSGKLTLQSAANSPVGQHEVTLRATARLNNQNLQVSQPLPLKIEAAAQ